jgi:hypothetical protein
MTPLEILAAKVRGAETNADGAAIIKDWYDNQTSHAINHAKESARILHEDAARPENLAGGLMEQAAKNFDGVVDLLKVSEVAY